MERIYFTVDRCVVCGAIVEEGRWVCAYCEEKGATLPKQAVPKSGQVPQKKKTCRLQKKKSKQ